MDEKVQLKREELVGEEVVLSDIYPTTNTSSVIDTKSSGEDMSIILDRIWNNINNKLSRVVNSVNGRTGVVVLSKADVGLENVDNMSWDNMQEQIIDLINDELDNRRLILLDELSDIGEYLDDDHLYAPFYAKTNDLTTAGTNKGLACIGYIYYDDTNSVYTYTYKSINVIAGSNNSILYNEQANGIDASGGKIAVNIVNDSTNNLLELKNPSASLKTSSGLMVDKTKIEDVLVNLTQGYSDITVGTKTTTIRKNISGMQSFLNSSMYSSYQMGPAGYRDTAVKSTTLNDKNGLSIVTDASLCTMSSYYYGEGLVNGVRQTTDRPDGSKLASNWAIRGEGPIQDTTGSASSEVTRFDWSCIGINLTKFVKDNTTAGEPKFDFVNLSGLRIDNPRVINGHTSGLNDYDNDWFGMTDGMNTDYNSNTFSTDQTTRVSGGLSVNVGKYLEISDDNESIPEKTDTYYESGKVNVRRGSGVVGGYTFTKLTSQPADWETNYQNYYVCDNQLAYENTKNGVFSYIDPVLSESITGSTKILLIDTPYGICADNQPATIPEDVQKVHHCTYVQGTVPYWKETNDTTDTPITTFTVGDIYIDDVTRRAYKPTVTTGIDRDDDLLNPNDSTNWWSNNYYKCIKYESKGSSYAKYNKSKSVPVFIASNINQDEDYFYQFNASLYTYEHFSIKHATYSDNMIYGYEKAIFEIATTNSTVTEYTCFNSIPFNLQLGVKDPFVRKGYIKIDGGVITFYKNKSGEEYGEAYTGNVNYLYYDIENNKSYIYDPSEYAAGYGEREVDWKHPLFIPTGNEASFSGTITDVYYALNGLLTAPTFTAGLYYKATPNNRLQTHLGVGENDSNDDMLRTTLTYTYNGQLTFISEYEQGVSYNKNQIVKSTFRNQLFLVNQNYSDYQFTSSYNMYDDIAIYDQATKTEIILLTPITLVPYDDGDETTSDITISRTGEIKFSQGIHGAVDFRVVAGKKIHVGEVVTIPNDVSYLYSTTNHDNRGRAFISLIYSDEVTDTTLKIWPDDVLTAADNVTLYNNFKYLISKGYIKEITRMNYTYDEVAGKPMIQGSTVTIPYASTYVDTDNNYDLRGRSFTVIQNEYTVDSTTYIRKWPYDIGVSSQTVAGLYNNLNTLLNSNSIRENISKTHYSYTEIADTVMIQGSTVTIPYGTSTTAYTGLEGRTFIVINNKNYNDETKLQRWPSADAGLSTNLNTLKTNHRIIELSLVAATT